MRAAEPTEVGAREPPMKRLPHLDGLRFLAQTAADETASLEGLPPLSVPAEQFVAAIRQTLASELGGEARVGPWLRGAVAGRFA